MNTSLSLAACALLLATLSPSLLRAQDFTSGSNGSYGAINITANTTLAMPADGIFHCTTINVASGATLSFARNALNTPVYLLATGDVSVAGTINVSSTAPADGSGSVVGGTGGPGGFDGGASGYISGGVVRPAGDGQGPGGGKRGASSWAGGSGSFATQGTQTGANRGATYGTELLIPLIGGSGGAGSDGMNGQHGGGGGGAILIASTTKITVSGAIRADAAVVNTYAVGSGGAIRLVSPRVYGSGTLSATSYGTYGGTGRIRVDSVFKVEPGDFTQKLAFNFQGVSSLGSTLLVFPTTVPELDLVALFNPNRTDIPLGSGPVTITLPNGSSPTVTFGVRYANFTQGFRIKVKVIPESGDSLTFTSTNIATPNATPTEVIFGGAIPVNMKCTVQAWTEPL